MDQTADRLDEKGRRALAECLSLADECSREVRTLSYLMHPPVLDVQGLGPAIRWSVEGFVQRRGMTVDLEMISLSERLTSDVEIALFRIVQESLTNVHRHSHSSKAAVRLIRDHEEIVLEVQDWGRGMPPDALESLRNGGSALGVGLRGMQERLGQFDGRLEIESSADAGTTVRAVLPSRAAEMIQDAPVQKREAAGDVPGHGGSGQVMAEPAPERSM